MTLRQWSRRIWLPCLAVAAWQLSASLGWTNPLFFPSPLHLTSTASELARSGELERHLGATVIRTLAAFAAGSAAGILTGLIVGSQPFWHRSLQSLFTGLSATPKLALLPAFLVLFGLNDSTRLLPAALSCFVLTAVYALDAARSVGKNYIDLARCYGAGRRALMMRVYFPACLPGLFTGMRLGLANALVMVVATEILAAPNGLGAFIWMTSQALALDRMYVGIALCTVVGIVMNQSFQMVERHVTPWVGD